MAFLWPGLLLLLALIPILITLYLWVLKRRRRYALRYSSLSLVRAAQPGRSAWRRHLPFGLFLLALTSLVVALSRPVMVVTVPTGQTTVILAIDVSLSMCQTDILPNRLTAAEQAALAFIEGQGASAQIGVVAFAGFAELIQTPTGDLELLEEAVESLLPGRRTAIGSGILEGLDAIAEADGTVAPVVRDPSAEAQPTPVPRGAYAPAIIVVLTDGVSNSGPSPIESARQAADRGVRVYTIGFGTESESSPFGGRQCDVGNLFRGGPFFGGGGGGGRGFRRGIDEATLIEVAEMTDATYHSAESADELNEVFRNLPTYLITRHETQEISVAFAGAAALLAALAVGLSLLWRPLP